MFAAVATFFAAMVSCTPEENKTKETVFPTIDDVTMEANTTKDITFTAEDDWTLVSDQSWCKFDDNGVQATTVSGTAGEVKVTVSVSDEGLEFSSATATIDMTMGGKTQNVFTVTRLAKERVCELYYLNDDDEIVKADENGLVFTYNNRLAMSNTIQADFKANFPWKVKSVSEQLDVDYEDWTGKADEELSSFGMEYISVKASALGSAFNGEIVVSDLEGNNECKFAVSYAGLGDNDIKVFGEGLDYGASVTFSHDGFLYYSTELTEEKNYNFSVFTKDGNFNYLVAEVYDYTPRRINPDWMHLTKGNNGEVSVAVDENTAKARTVYLLFFPSATDLNSVDLYDYFDEEGYFNLNKNAFQLTQKGAPIDGGWRLGWGSYAAFESPVVKFSEYKGTNLGGLTNFPYSPEDNTYVCELSLNAMTAEDGTGTSLIVSPIGYEGEDPTSTTRIYPIEAPEGFAEGTMLYDMSDGFQQFPAIMLDLSVLGLQEEYLDEPLFFSVNTYFTDEGYSGYGKADVSLVIVIKK